MIVVNLLKVTNAPVSVVDFCVLMAIHVANSAGNPVVLVTFGLNACYLAAIQHKQPVTRIQQKSNVKSPKT